MSGTVITQQQVINSIFNTIHGQTFEKCAAIFLSDDWFIEHKEDMVGKRFVEIELEGNNLSVKKLNSETKNFCMIHWVVHIVYPILNEL